MRLTMPLALMLVLALGLPVASLAVMPSSLTASGAGTSSVNGIYTLSAGVDSNGNKYYSNGANFAYWAQAPFLGVYGWAIGQTLNGFTLLYVPSAGAFTNTLAGDPTTQTFAARNGAAAAPVFLVTTSNPVTVSLTASLASLVSGGTTILTWVTTNATSVSINNAVGTITPISGGSVSVSPLVTTTYIITATGSSTVTASVIVTVTPAPVPTVTVSVSPSSVNLGSGSTLVWTSTGASSITVSGQSSPAMSGSASVAPTSTTTYTVAATGAGGTTTRTATLTIVLNPLFAADSGTVEPTNLNSGFFNGTVTNAGTYLNNLIKNFAICALLIALSLFGWYLVRRQIRSVIP